MADDLQRKISLDTTDFKSGIAQINREMRVLESSFRANAAQLGDWGNQASGLEMRIKTLSTALELQKSKVEAVRSEYERVAAEKGANSREAQELEIRLNRETETLGKMGVELQTTQGKLDEMGQESSETGEQVEELGVKQEETAEKTVNFGGVLDGLKGTLTVVAGAVAGVVAGVAALGAGITKLVLDAAEAGGELVDMSLKTGLSTTRLQELAYVGEQVGTSVETISSSMVRLTRTMGTAQAGGTDAAAAFAALGVSYVDSSGNLRSTEDVFNDAITALGDVENQAERDALAMELFGRSAVELNPLIKTGTEELERLSNEAHTVGAVMSEENVAALESFGDQLASLKMGLQGTLGTLASAFLPAFQGLAGTAQHYLGQFSSIVSGANGDLGVMASGIGGLIGQIATDLAQQGPQMLQAGLNILTGIMNALISSLPTILPAVVQMLQALVGFITTALPILIQAGVQLLVALVTGMKDAIPQLITAVIEIIPVLISALLEALPLLIEAAMSLIMAIVEGLTNALPQIIEMAPEIIITLVTSLLDMLPELIEAALEMIIALAQGLIDALPELIEAAPEIITTIFETLIGLLPTIGEAAVEIIMALITGIAEMLPTLGESAPEIIGALVEGLLGMTNTLLEVGANIVLGIWDGIAGQFDWLTEQFGLFWDNLIGGVKDLLGIQSPSTVFAGIGENLALGLGEGFAGAFRDIERDINGAVADLGKVPVTGGGLSAAGAGAGGATININATVANGVDMYRMARIVAEEIQRRR